MSIQSEITRITNNVQDTIDVIAQTGVSAPAGANSDNLPSLAQALANEKQDKLTGTQGQVVGFDESGNAVAQNASFGRPTAIPISIPTTGWTDNKQTFTVTGIPADPTTYEVHLSQVGATNVAAAMACGIYIADEAQNSLTLAVNSVPETAFQVYAVVQEVSA